RGSRVPASDLPGAAAHVSAVRPGWSPIGRRGRPTVAARFHPFQQMQVVLACRGEDIDVLDDLISYRLDIVLLAGGNEQDRAGSDLVAGLAHVIDGAPLHDE